ncbi:MAG: DNA mismatch repair endonuclease MutL [Rikenellaceae bacterium]
MSDRIKLLPEKVSNQIAAGEVVVRPSSVIKEMMENTIDAGADEVIVNFRKGGYELMQIVDNGCGMSPNDARMAFERHATSKIAKADDIYALKSFGFRGEALASISAIARVELKTRQEGDNIGTSTVINGGVFEGQKPCICEKGSQFFVRDLFYNIPVRRRFTDKESTTVNQIKAEFRRVALCYPHIRFELYGNDAPIYNLAPATLAGRIVDIVGKSIKQNLSEVNADTSIVKIKGFIGKPSSAKKNNADQYLFVNGRFFKSPAFAKAILRGYDKLIAEGQNPSFFLFLEVDPQRVDVNIHPQKTEVKFADDDAIWQIINAAVRETLAKSGVVPMMEFDASSEIDIPVATQGVSYAVPKSSSGADYNPFDTGYIDTSASNPDVDFTGFDVPVSEFISKPTATKPKSSPKPQRGKGLMDSGYETIEAFEAESFESAGFSDFPSSFETFKTTETSNDDDDYETIESEAVINAEFRDSSFTESSFEMIESEDQQPEIEFSNDYESIASVEIHFIGATPIQGGYISTILDRELVIVDAKRAKERVLFDHYFRQLNNGSAVSQQLLFAERLMLSTQEYELLEECATDFALLGFDIDYLGDGAIDVKGIPADTSSEQVDRVIYELLQLLASPESVENRRRERIATTMAQSGARAVSRHLTTEQATELLNQLALCHDISHTPSGHAILCRVSTEEIRTKLK